MRKKISLYRSKSQQRPLRIYLRVFVLGLLTAALPRCLQWLKWTSLIDGWNTSVDKVIPTGQAFRTQQSARMDPFWMVNPQPKCQKKGENYKVVPIPIKWDFTRLHCIVEIFQNLTKWSKQTSKKALYIFGREQVMHVTNPTTEHDKVCKRFSLPEFCLFLSCQIHFSLAFHTTDTLILMYAGSLLSCISQV